MTHIGVVVFIMFQVSMLVFPSDEKRLVLSQEDNDWLGRARETILQSTDPHIQIASHMAFVVNHSELLFNGDRYLQKNIKHAQNWLRYFNKIRLLNEEGRLQFCKYLKDSVLFIRSLGGYSEDFETSSFLKLFDYGINVEKRPLIKEPDSFIKLYNTVSDCPSLVNNFIYFYKPSLDFFVTKENARSPFLGVMVDSYWVQQISYNCTVEGFKKKFTPIMYEVTEECVIKSPYQDVQKKVITFLCALKFREKKQKIKIPRPVVQTLILNQCPDVVFLKYCNEVQQQVGSQVEWIKENDPEYYKNRLLLFPFMASAENFEQWYNTLKYPEEELY